MLNETRQYLVFRHHGILPGNLAFRNVRVVVPVALPDDLVVQRMVVQVHPQVLQDPVLEFVLGQETEVIMCRGHGDARGLGGIDRTQRLGHILHRVRILEPAAEDEHVAVEARHSGFDGRGIQHLAGAADGQQGRHSQFKQPFHKRIVFLDAKVAQTSRLISRLNV